ncbi:MAG: DUF4340 domain-containing protein [Pseudomonadota bacterium]
MKTQQWGALAWITLVVVALGVGLSMWRDHDASAKPKPAFPQLESQLNEVAKISVRAANNVAVTLERTDAGWVVADKSRYPADSGMLRKELLQLAHLELLEAKTKKPENYAQLGVQALDQAGSEAIEVQVFGANNAMVAHALVGKNANGGAYLRLGHDAQTWLASARPAFATKPEDWLEKEIANIDAQRLSKVSVQANGASYTIEKSTGNDTPVLKDVPKGRAVKDSEVRRIIGGLSNLRFENVLPAAQAPSAKSAVKMRFETADGLVVETMTYKDADKIYTTFTPSFAAKPPTAAPAPSKDGQAPVVTPTPSNNTAVVANAQGESEKLKQRLNGWVYVIPAHQADVLMLNRDALLEPMVKTKAKK